MDLKKIYRQRLSPVFERIKKTIIVKKETAESERKTIKADSEYTNNHQSKWKYMKAACGSQHA
ncbi:hypothetical protein [Photobacterium satsumensis]|uniref:hypothetical protein n=1 Tax=Photobacterium satsumensis TaxID=2910239 RepID=UPI003D118AA2